ncbi:aminotransferase class V, putative [Acanthamoeba castellanii str. Neff]|uniref:Aminotransferase class V, putative n=1 Tax=Acanthamoeba castellanii (strain ATCC 30010 / Neff) TaxID=1257118 RepID=L8GSP5_ACACF|nr:aminotransferase class V, putative [Acanthamoeba castellanii str. Neff]ELR15126.1 aminotransferase class V, putative [Acanthamoeba castellanii str. Neff]
MATATRPPPADTRTLARSGGMAARAPIYLDYNATTPISREVADVMRPFLDHFFGNPSSGHLFGASTKKAVEAARLQVAEALGCGVDEIVFTSGGTESNNYAIKGYALQHKHKGRHIITSAVEHPAVEEVVKYLEREEDFYVTRLPVNEEGLVSLQDLEEAIRADTILVTIMHANNEVGTLMPIKEIVDIVRQKAGARIAVHTDAAQSIGKVRVRVDEMGVDMLSVCAHKLYAPKGTRTALLPSNPSVAARVQVTCHLTWRRLPSRVLPGVGALYVRRGVELKKLMHGADHEAGRRPGTENTLLVPGLGMACTICARDLNRNSQHMKELRDRLQANLTEACKALGLETRVNGPKDDSKRLPNTLSISFRGIEANALLSEIHAQVAASAGAACHSESITVSPVLTAMRVPME